MDRCALVFLLLALCAGCLHKKTSEEDAELDEFAEARQRAATYYDGGDYARSAAQYQRALEIRPDHVPSRLGYAYSLMYTDLPSHEVRAQKELTDMGTLDDDRLEVKRTYCMAMVHRSLGKHYDRRSRLREQEGNLRNAGTDRTAAREHARLSIRHFQEVLDIDDRLATRYSAGRRVSASLKPDAYLGMAHCEIILGDAENQEPFDRAEEHINQFASVARTARRFWMEQRKRLMAEDPLTSGMAGDPGSATPTELERERYERRIFNTINEEVAARRALLDTYLYLNHFLPAIKEADVILSLDEDVDEVILIRGRCYGMLNPPNYDAALKDLKAYRARMAEGGKRLTEASVRLNKLIRTWEERLADQRAGRGPS